MKVVLGRNLGDDYVCDLRTKFPEIELQPAYTVEEAIRTIEDAHVYCGELNRDLFLAAKELKWVHFPGAGFDRMVTNIPEFVESNTVLTNAPGTHVIAIADFVLGVILAFAHRIPDLIEDQHARRWAPEKSMESVMELSGTTMGVIGMGGIGKAVAQRAKGFEVDVYAVDVNPMTPPVGVCEVWALDRLDELLQLSDWLVVTPPLTSATRGMLDRCRIEKFKMGGHLTVVSRGGIVDENAVIDGLRSGRIAGAAFDALGEEPLPPDNPLWGMSNVIISPHACAETPILWARRKEIFKENLRRYIAGEDLMHICDKKAGY